MGSLSKSEGSKVVTRLSHAMVNAKDCFRIATVFNDRARQRIAEAVIVSRPWFALAKALLD
jgi:hypothetical protein